MTRFVDRGAIVAAYVGIGMAAVMAVSFLLVIPIPIVYALLAVPAGLLIGYYADSRSESSRPNGGDTLRRQPQTPMRLSLGRLLTNGLFAGAVTAATMAVLGLAIDALFFYADNGYRDQSLGASLQCQAGPACVYARYLADGQRDQLRREGVTDVDSFTRFYWQQQLTTAGTIFALCAVSSIGGALIYRAARPRGTPPSAGASVA